MTNAKEKRLRKILFRRTELEKSKQGPDDTSADTPTDSIDETATDAPKKSKLAKLIKKIKG